MWNRRSYSTPNSFLRADDHALEKETPFSGLCLKQVHLSQARKLFLLLIMSQHWQIVGLPLSQTPQPVIIPYGAICKER